jgi:hypothetical protein
MDEKLQRPSKEEERSAVAGTSFAPPTITPEMVVIASWRELEARMRAMTDSIRPGKIGNISVLPLRIEEAARELGLGDDDIQSLRLLRKLRNEVAHAVDTQLSWEDVSRFREAIARLASRLQKPQGK